MTPKDFNIPINNVSDWAKLSAPSEFDSLGYKSPVEIILSELTTKLENDTLTAVQNYGICVDRDELIKALQYDREQYEKGYKDATLKFAHEWIDANEQIPEDMQKVLIWFEYFRYGDFNCMYQTYGFGYVCDGKWSPFINGETGWQDYRVIAWQPLPKPYKEGGAE